MRCAMEIVRERGNEEELLMPFDALKASIDLFFRGVLTADMFELY